MSYDVTIGIPVYRVEDYIERTMTSILMQTYPNIEFLIVDDGCDDRSIDIVNEIKATHRRGEAIRIITFPHNYGAFEARNRIIEEATGTYLYLMDADDVIEKDAIETLVQEATAFKADVVFGSYEKTEIDGTKIVYQYPDAKYESGDAFASYAYRRYAGIQASACNFLVKTALLREKGIHFCKSKFWEDTVFTLELTTHVKRAVLLSKITYYYLCREHSLTDIRYDRQIEQQELQQYLLTIEHLKQDKARLKSKPYYPNWCYVAVMSDFYIICNILKRRQYITPPFSDQQLRDCLRHPATLSEIFKFKQRRIQNLLLYILGKLPAPVCIAFIKVAGKLKGLI